MSSFLFVINGEAFSRMASPAENAGLIRGFGAATEAHSILHLQFADTLIFSDARVDHIQNVKAILICFEAVSGMRVDFSKSASRRFGVQNKAAPSIISWTSSLFREGQEICLESGVGKIGKKKAINVEGCLPFSWWWDNLNQVSPL